ncbi:uncharacterized protein LOC124679248 [Lolium rigidum]|uniref:uncharacterized protein LOC124679248 n=1 Tax=Lolium rigidum TaxID=89674 RepID=UPI001F5C642C|nr:uncharacterized protein LOC124679248 [Lolium rigidum]
MMIVSACGKQIELANEIQSNIYTSLSADQFSVTCLMGSTEAILSAQMASKCFSVSKFMASPVPQMQKQCDGSSSASSASRRQVEKNETNSFAAKIVGMQQQQLKPRFALELDGLNCFETIVPL